MQAAPANDHGRTFVSWSVVASTDREGCKAACDAWRSLLAEPTTITSIGHRGWASPWMRETGFRDVQIVPLQGPYAMAVGRK